VHAQLDARDVTDRPSHRAPLGWCLHLPIVALERQRGQGPSALSAAARVYDDPAVIDLTDNKTAWRIVVLGRQGSGKGEQCRRLASRFGLDHVSTGELLRAAARDGTSVGEVSESYLVRGDPVPDDIVAGLVAERLALATAEGLGIVLDGYPRSVSQAMRLERLIAPASLDVAIHLDVPRSVCVERIQNRRVCLACHISGPWARCPVCGGTTSRRADDWPAAIGRRMSDYAREMVPLLAWYDTRRLLEVVDGLGTPTAVEARVASVVDALAARSGASRSSG
jgi:adenylate kinase